MLDKLFGSKTRVRLLRLLLNNPDRPFFVRELSRRVGAQINAVRNEIDNLRKLDLIRLADGPSADDDAVVGHRAVSQRKYFQVNSSSLLYPELVALFQKSQGLLEKDFTRKLVQSGQLSYLSLGGFFVGESDAPTDIFAVGKVSREKFTGVIKGFEREVGREINFTIMTAQEFKYRREVTDRFLYSILDSRRQVVLDSFTDNQGD